MNLINRPMRLGVATLLGLATAGACALTAGASASVASARYVALSGSTVAVHGVRTGGYSSARMSVEVALAPRDEAGLNARLRSLYTKGSANYHHWLARGQFDALYAPTAAARSRIDGYLKSSGLAIEPSASPFLVRAVGTSQQVSAAFHTTLSTYRGNGGARFFANSTAVRLPAALASGVLGVIGLDNTFRNHPAYTVTPEAKRPSVRSARSASASCETPYPTTAQLFAFYNSGTLFPFGYGGGPACSGLTPSQVNSIYGAPDVGAKGKGAGVTMAVVEFSAYQEQDNVTWAQTFYGSRYKMPQMDNVLVDGGPLNPQCPAGDTCPASFNGYDGDLEVDLDIQRELTIAPDAAKIIIYNAANDVSGQTALDVNARIANDDTAATVSNSWVDDPESAIPQFAPPGFAQAENEVFEQMAMQGQSYVASAGDDGPVGAGTTNTVGSNDPAAQPWVTAAGGTTFEGWNPGANPEPGYPAGKEMVWNADSLCQASNTLVGGHTGYFYCTAPDAYAGVGNAGSGGSSQFWGRPWYQTGPGVNNPFTTYGNGSTQCSFAAVGTPCREIPDVSSIGDVYTPYADYCTATASLANSLCYPLESKESQTGWFGVAGTSSSAPLWAAIAADRDSYTGSRTGFLNPLLYLLFNIDPGKYFNDITGIGQAVTTNGLFPTTPGYDEATGIGTPKMAALITETS
jgi:subtilase family serine protease